MPFRSPRVDLMSPGRGVGTSILGKAEPPFTLLDILGNQQGPGPALGQLKTMLLEPGGHPGIFPSLQSGLGPGAGMEMMPGGGVAGITRPTAGLEDLGRRLTPHNFSREETLKFDTPESHLFIHDPALRDFPAKKAVQADPKQPKTFTFHLNKEGKPLNPIARARRVGSMAQKIVEEVEELGVRARNGDHNAQVMLAHHDWYKRVKKVMVEAFGEESLATRFQVEAAFSRQTPPKDQHRYATEFLRRYENGELDGFMADVRRHMLNGGNPHPKSVNNPNGYPMEKYPTQADGKQYGLNTGMATQRLIEIEDAGGAITPRPGMRPKVLRYGANMAQESHRPTIDIWMGRAMQRLAGLPTTFKAGDVPGTFSLPGSFRQWKGKVKPEITAAYGVASDAVERAAAKLGIEPDELQAIMWMREKELWESKGWTNIDRSPDLARVIEERLSAEP